MSGAVAFVAGLLFALGLGLGGMTEPAKVLGFLDVAGAWDPSLALVMIGAVLVYATIGRRALARPKPLLADAFQVPTRRDVDGPLVAGALLFGVGWGLSGYCPGPAVVSLAAGAPATLLFVASMLLGMWLEERVVARGRSAPGVLGAGGQAARRVATTGMPSDGASVTERRTMRAS